MWNSIKYIRKNGTFRRVGKSAEYVFSSSQSGNTNVSTSEDCRYYTRIGKYLPNHISLALKQEYAKSSHCKYLHDPSHIRLVVNTYKTSTNTNSSSKPRTWWTQYPQFVSIISRAAAPVPTAIFAQWKPQDPDLYICFRKSTIFCWGCPRP